MRSRSITIASERTPAIEPALRQEIAHVTARVQERHPSASAALVERCVDEALHHYRDARVRTYLGILLERRASEAVEHATTT